MKAALKIITVLAIAFGSACIGYVFAQTTHEDEAKAITEYITSRLKGMEVSNVEPTPIVGIYRAVMDNEQSVFVLDGGRYLLAGDMYEVVNGRLRLAFETEEQVRRKELFEGLPDDQLVSFLPGSGEIKHVLYVYTDISCGYCRAFHNQIPELNDMGIAIHYLAFPRGGVESPAYTEMHNVWCASDAKTALTKAKRKQTVMPAPESCRSPVADQYALGVQMGVRGTPSVYTGSGEHVGGFLTVEEAADVFRIGAP